MSHWRAEQRVHTLNLIIDMFNYPHGALVALVLRCRKQCRRLFTVCPPPLTVGFDWCSLAAGRRFRQCLCPSNAGSRKDVSRDPSWFAWPLRRGQTHDQFQSIGHMPHLLNTGFAPLGEWILSILIPPSGPKRQPNVEVLMKSAEHTLSPIH